MTSPNPRLLRLTVPAAAVLVALVPALASADPLPKAPATPMVQAFDGDTTLPSADRIKKYCAAHPGSCRFTIDTAASGEYYSAVKSFGNAVVNCTKDPITVARQIVLRTGSTDNLGGDITGKISIEGQINASGEVTAGVNAKGSGEFTTPNKAQGPSATVGAEAGVNGSGKVGGSVGVRGAFEGAFKLAYQRSWTTEQTETTTYTTTVRPGEALAFGASAAMQRVAGTLTTGTGLTARRVVVDGPSSVNNSTFMADTFTVPGTACNKVSAETKTDVEINAQAAKQIAEQQKKNQEAAGQADKDIKTAAAKFQECPPGSSACMEKLAGKGEREEGGIKDMTRTIADFRPEPPDNAAAVVASTCANFPASLPEGAADEGQAPFPASQLCPLLGS